MRNPRVWWLLPVVGIALLFLAPPDPVFQHLSETLLGEVIFNTLWLLLGVGIGVTVLGVTLAWLTAACDFPGRKFLEGGLMLPLAIPPYVTAFVAIGLLDFTGPIQTALRGLFGPIPFPEIRSTGGVIGVLTCALYPYVYLLARNAFLTQGPAALEVAQSLGQGRVSGFFRVVLPMARPWILNGLGMAFMETLSDFGAVSIFNYDTFTVAIYKAWFALFSLPTAARLAGFLGLLCFCLFLMETLFLSGPRYAPLGRSLRIRLTGARGVLAMAYAGLVFFLAFLVPVGQLLIWAARSASQELDARYWGFLQHSLWLGAMAAGLTGVVALLLGFAGRRSAGARVLIRFTTLGYAIPGSVLAVLAFILFAYADERIQALLRYFLGPGLPVGTLLNGTLFALLLGYLVRFLSVAYGTIDGAIRRVTPGLDEAARGLGFGGLDRLRKIYFPMMRGGMLTAVALVFVDVMKEMPMTLMMRPFGWDTLSVRIFEMTSEGAWERAAIPGVFLVLAGSLPVMALIKWEMHRQDENI